MIIAVPRESEDPRTPLTPENARKLSAVDGLKVVVESGLSHYWPDEEFVAAGVRVVTSSQELLKDADVVLRIHATPPEELAALKRGVLHISLLDPYNNRDLVEAYAGAGVDAISLEMIPRVTTAQKMDVLSSQASLAGYAAVVLAAERLKKIFPMMMTPAGTIAPAKVFVIGAGVAGLQAIATAKRLGARVEAFDTRPVVEEQVQSLGARFLKVDLGQTGQTKDGYAKALTDEQLSRQRQAMAKAVAGADVTITTAKLFGRKAPIIVTADMLREVRPGSVIVDLAAGSGGNVEGIKVDKEIDINGVHLIGIDNLPGEVAVDASRMLSSNMLNLLLHLRDEKTGTLKTVVSNTSSLDEITAGCLVVSGGSVIHPEIKNHYEGEK